MTMWTCPSGHRLPASAFHSYARTKPEFTGYDRVEFTCDGGKRGHSFTLTKAVQSGMFTTEEADKLVAAAEATKEEDDGET